MKPARRRRRRGTREDFGIRHFLQCPGYQVRDHGMTPYKVSVVRLGHQFATKRFGSGSNLDGWTFHRTIVGQ
ncbi:hypothetical protein MesoLj131b_76710 (plasmid) [Mesorhizobium sp. 131-2-5]|nr:hypothetical protein MesoLj131b_76710 [Mesorhizobium sp. 131-2-5]